ncbi:hypothetical protein RQP46_010255 [Phenoliferia psychrophenolica]
MAPTKRTKSDSPDASSDAEEDDAPAAAPAPSKKARAAPSIDFKALVEQATPSRLADFLDSNLTAEQKSLFKTTFGDKNTTSFHCVRCHQAFTNATDRKGACKIEAYEISFDGPEDRNGYYEGSCLGCDWSGTVTEDGETVGGRTHYCFEGRHTTDASKVDYGEDNENDQFPNVVTCEENECPSE